MSRVVFYSGVAAFLFGMDYMQKRAIAESTDSSRTFEARHATITEIPVGVQRVQRVTN